MIPQVGWSEWPSRRRPAASAQAVAAAPAPRPAETPAAAAATAAVEPTAAEPAPADRDRRPSRRPTPADSAAGGPAAPATGPTTAGAGGAVAPTSLADRGQGGDEAATTQDPAAAGSGPAVAASAPVEAGLSELLQRGRAVVSDAVVSSQSRISDLGQRWGAFGRERWQGLRDLVRDCLDESLSPLRAAEEDPAAAPAPPPDRQSRAARIEGTAADGATGRTAAAAASQATAPPASAGPGLGPGRASPPPLFGTRLDAASSDASTPPVLSHDQADRRSDAAASRPAPAPAALSDLQAWLPNSRDLPRAS